MDDMDRANAIVDWSVKTGRDPFDTAGIDTSDEEWMGQNPNWNDYIESEVIERNLNKQKTKPTAKTAKKSTTKYEYPPEYLKKDGTLKKAYKKKAAQYRKTHSQTRTRSKSRSPDKVEQTQNSNIAKFINDLREFESPDNSSVEDIGLYDMPPDIDNKLLDELVFQGDTDRRMNIERCRRLREFCTLYPRTCAFDEDFKKKYVEPCVSRYNIQDVRGRKNQAYSDVMKYKGAITPQAKHQANINYSYYGRPDHSSIPRYIDAIDRNVHNPSGSVFKKHGREALKKAINFGFHPFSTQKDSALSWQTPNKSGYNMLNLKKDIMDNPLLLDEIIGEFRINAREKGYGDKAINDMIRKFIDHLYVD